MKPPITIAMAIAAYVEDRAGRILPKTLEEQASRLRLLQEVIGARQLRQEHKMAMVEDIARRLQRWVDGSTFTPATIHLRLSTWSGFFAYCLRKGWLFYNPCRFVKRPRQALKAPPTFTYQEYEVIKAASIGTPYHWFTVASYRLGFSMVDVCTLQWVHVDMARLFVAKERQKLRRFGAAPTTVPFLPGSDLHLLLQELREHPCEMWPGVEYVCPELSSIFLGNPIRVRMGYARLLARLGIKGKSAMHWRHTFISAIANSQTPTALACKMSGHANPAMLARYVKPDLEAMRASIIRANEFMEQDTVKII